MRKFKKFIFIALFISCAASSRAQIMNKVVAVVNDEVITQQDVEQLLAVLYAQYANAYNQDELVKKMEEMRKDILIQMVEDRLILSRAKELDVKVEEKEIEEKLKYIKDGFPSEEEFYKTLEVQGITIANLKDRYRDQIMMKKLVDFEVKGRASVLPSEVAEYYENNRQDFIRNKEYKVRHIFTKAEGNIGFELAMVESNNIYNKLKDGHDFGKLAKEYSQGPNKEEGGDMGYIEQGKMREELDKAIFFLKLGEFSEPVRSELGYHIFKVEDIKDSGYFSLEEVQKDIKAMLFQKRFKERLREWVAELKSKAYISMKD